MPVIQAVSVRGSFGSWKLQCILGSITDAGAIELSEEAPKCTLAHSMGSLVRPQIWLTFVDLLCDHGPYGFPWSSLLADRSVRDSVIKKYKLDYGFTDGTHELFVWYHGTSTDLMSTIVRSRLRAGSTPAMLGLGVYFGSFWKACRYAMFENTRDWAERRDRARGSVLRCLIRVPRDRILRLPTETWSCPCFKCENRIRCATSAQLEHRKKVARLCDHESCWSKEYDACLIEDTLDTMTHGESCVRDDSVRDLVVIMDHGSLNFRTRTEPYDPNCRDHRIYVGTDDT
jgi:hypothetical protein